MDDNGGLEPIAIIGFAFEFPQDATSSDRFWEMLCEGRSASTEFPEDRLNAKAFYHPDATRQSTISVRGGNFVQEDLGAFDAPFFSITPGEAACMDPQHRRMLETAYHALEDAGIPISECWGSDTSVYTGCFTNDYLSILQQDYEVEQRHVAMGIAPSMLANRVSWFFNFKGTSMNLDSACSSSLIALHLACQELRSGNSSMALVGGANLVYHPNFIKIMSSSNFLSPDSQCWSFDDRANGYARGEGSVMIVVKRLADALRDNNTIRSIIRNTGSNQDGRTLGITQPSLESQIDLIQRTYRQANIDMGPTRFFEAHGTGTPVGDPVEANAIGQAFRKHRTKQDPLYIGAVKANIGHLEGASGLAGVIKTLLVLENGIIPPIAGLETLNRRIDPIKLGLNFPKEATPWPTTGLRRGCVNSFGFGGTNATAILDDVYHYLELHGLRGHHRTRRVPPGSYSSLCHEQDITHEAILPCSLSPLLKDGKPRNKVTQRCEKPKLLVWSAADKTAAENLTTAYREYASQQSCNFSVLAYSLSSRRSELPWRSFMVVDPQTSLSSDDLQPTHPVKARDDIRLTFLFTGQGAQYLGMGRELFDFPAFRNSIDLLETCLKKLECPWSLRQLLEFGDNGVAIDAPEYSQTLMTCLQIALVDLLETLGVVPAVVLGHSSGEIAAAYAMGGLSRLSAVKVAFYRGLLSSQLARRKCNLSMMAVGISRKEAMSYIHRLSGIVGSADVSVGCVNSPRNITLTGNVQQLEILRKWFEADSVLVRKLRVPIAYHSEVMNEIVGDYRLAMGDLQPGERSGSTVVVSSVTQGLVMTEALSNAEYWARNLTSTVEFEGALCRLLDQPDKQPWGQLGQSPSIDLRVSHILEIGPHTTLQGVVAESLREAKKAEIPVYVPLLIRQRNSYSCLLETVGKLHCAGHPVNVLKANGLEDTSQLMPPNLPTYPFNHKNLYWKEGRLSKNFRFRTAPRHDLLGVRDIDWNPQAARWRNILRLSEMPWLKDHRVDGQIVLPATGMVVMAVEALRQLLGPIKDFSGVQIKEVDFLHAIRFTQGVEQIETQLTLSSESQPAISTWSQFRLFVIENGSYVECCRGFIQAIARSDSQPPEITVAAGKPLQEWISRVTDACGLSKDPYNLSTGSIVTYGPSFQNLENMRLGSGGEAVADVNIDTWRTNKICEGWAPKYTVHPCTMDGLAQLIVPSLAERHSPLPTMVPIRADSIWIDCSEPSLLQQGRIHAVAKCTRANRGATADIVGIQKDPLRPLLVIEGLDTTFIGTIANDEEKSGPRPLCTRLIWRPDFDLMSHDQILTEITRERPKEQEGAVFQHTSLMLVILCFIEEAIEYMEKHPSSFTPLYLHAYIDWMRYQQLSHEGISRATVKGILSNNEAHKLLVNNIKDTGTDGEFFMHVGRHLIAILSGDADPLDVMFRNGLTDRYYEQMLANPHHAHPASVYIDHLCFKNPSMNIIEIGAGTGGQTSRTLETLASNGVMKCARYDYTDISPGFFPRAQEKFKAYTDIMQFRVRDISKGPIAQSFEPASYDLVLASHVLHATEKLDDSLSNVRRLLKPGGKLILFETTNPDALHIGFAFGLLKGWWNPLDHEARSRHSPCLTTAQWDERLKRNGFSGIDIEIPGQENIECRYSSIVISTALEQSSEVVDAAGGIILVRNEGAGYQCQVADDIGKQAPVVTCSLVELAGINISASTLVVFLLELHAVLLHGIAAMDYNILRAILSTTKTVLWVSQPATQIQTPFQHLAEGLGRTLASEDATRKFVTLALDCAETSDRVSGYILKLMRQIRASPIDKLETNYTAKDGILRIPRVSENGIMNERVARMLKPRCQQVCQLGANTLVSLHLGPHGASREIGYRERARDPSSLKQAELLVQVKAFGLTFRDYVVVSGQVDQLTLGTECAGVVQEAGSKTDFQPGDRVCLIGAYLACTQARVKASHVVSIPANMTFAEAASLPTSLWVAYYAMHRMARVEEGETVLIHQGSSSVGQMMIQLALRQGVRVLVTASTTAKRDFICDTFGIPKTDVFSADDPSFRGKVYEVTGGQGVDLVIGALAGLDGLDFSECLAPCGRIIDIGVKVPRSPAISVPRRQPMNISHTFLSMLDILQRKPDLAHRIFHKAMRFYLEEHLKPPQPLKVFQVGDVEAAFHSFQNSDNIGKRVVELTEGMPLEVDCITKPLYTFSANASYVIAGGLGGLGRSFARWMASRGARHLILLSRSGVQTSASHELVNGLRAQGVYISTPKVDISDLESLKKTIDNLAKTMPRIRGCIQATVALRDSLFDKMTHEDWVVSTSSKATGSWNLHQTLPGDLDFFVLLASLNGIFGSRAQANYAAGNTFQDALSQYRLSRGQKAVSIDLGLMVAEGVVAESEFLLASMRRIGHLMEIAQEELIALLDYYCDPDLPLLSVDDAQVLVGIELPSAIKAKEIDLHHSMRRPIFSHLFRMGIHGSSRKEPNWVNAVDIDRPAALRAAASPDEAATLVIEWTSTKVGQVLGLSASDIEPSKPIHTYGIDSLVAVDLKNWFEMEIGANFTVFDLMGNTPLRELSMLAAQESRYRICT
ncbi:putative polyketide synthase [Aspergillus ellipticus CBS 707.79]|uniref:Putative polyketide synthase n=1 Tax=Aspergillus ellipticus CBS 707.79 TaxID=1448320 RepID=A0A319D4D2_9EURO|nr:putative polyketide synthase [Aspergillus ellipticus CBS 707.79]